MEADSKTVTLFKRELYLYVDLECCGCGKLVALSNMVHVGRHYYCRKCEEVRKMAEPSKKSPAMEKMLDTATQSIFGKKRTEAIKSDTCVCCGKEAKEFKDELSKKEFTISGMCQACQDSVFEKEE